ncbi:MAG TPA: sigma 54-interacting transcriptional regulator [Thermoanaerobaculia bacterium]|nr:sigma 54-interacting transcriptional regulator [Thermoanaerobaculia bacterium]
MTEQLTTESSSEAEPLPPGPCLSAVSGPLAGQILPLRPEGAILGRHPSCTLCLPDQSISRRHCELTPEGASFRLRDVGSTHGTFVNGFRVEEWRLEPGDLITLGDSTFQFQRMGEGAGEETRAYLLDDTPYVAKSETHLPPGAGDLGETRTARDLQALLRIGQSLHALRETASLARRLLELTREALDAERVCLLLLDPTGELTTAFALDAEGSASLFSVSRTLVERIVSDRSAVLANDVFRAGEPLSRATSVASAFIQSLAAAPLTGPETVLGVLYADTRVVGRRFDQGNVDWLTAAAGIAGSALANVRQVETLREENRRIEAALDPGMVGDGPRMREVHRFLARAAPTDSTILLRGESGTGKEMAARAVHRGSPRAGKPFVAINCASLTETLLESELFGHEKGAFTGAVMRKIGKIEAAEGGTLFLDEIGELAPPLQARLLRVLQEREFERVGGTRPIRANVRVVAATNRDLERAMREGTFREDLFYRLNVLSVILPPLRERPEDIPRLAGHFTALFSRRVGRPVAGLSPEARACLLCYPWPGNVRELANAIERAVVLGEGHLILPEDLPETLIETAPGDRGAPVGKYHEEVNGFKKRLILDAVDQAGGNVAKAAESLDLNPTYLHRLMRNFGLKA